MVPTFTCGLVRSNLPFAMAVSLLGGAAGWNGAHEWNRTIDLLLTKEVLYRLSYVSVKPKLCGRPGGTSMERETGIEPAPSAWKAEVLPLNYSRAGRPLFATNRVTLNGGGRWI